MGKVTEKEEKVKMPGIGHLSGNRLQRQKIFGQKGKSVEPVLKMVNLYFNIIKIHSCALTVLAETVVRLRLRLPPPAS
jgi:hypothetical protein